MTAAEQPRNMLDGKLNDEDVIVVFRLLISAQLTYINIEDNSTLSFSPEKLKEYLERIVCSHSPDENLDGYTVCHFITSRCIDLNSDIDFYLQVLLEVLVLNKLVVKEVKIISEVRFIFYSLNNEVLERYRKAQEIKNIRSN